MSRELAGVIACLQEVEIACKKLQQKGGVDLPQEFQQLQSLLQKFFAGAELAKAEQIHDHLAEIKRASDAENSRFHFFSIRVEVDAHLSSLADLQIELQEVLEDLA